MPNAKLPMPTPTFGRFTGTAAALERTEFFTWFNLRRVPAETGNDAVVYSPDNDEIRSDVAVVLLMTPTQETRRLTLQVRRTFLEDRRYEASARDLIKSFLLAVSGEDEPRLVAVAREIQFRGLRSPILVRRPGPALSDRPSTIFNVVMDWERGPLMVELRRVILWLDNTQRDDERRLIVRVYPIGSPELALLVDTVTTRGMRIRETGL